MSLSLRNLAICGSLAVAGLAMAQTTAPKVTMAWNELISEANSTNSRDGAGFGNKIYFSDKSKNAVYSWDPTTKAVTKIADVNGLNTAITLDDVGNVLVARGWAGAAGAKNYTIIAPDGTTTDFTADLHENQAVTPGRADMLGRVVGNMLSEEGAIFYNFPQGCTATSMIYVQNGAQADGVFSFFNSATITKNTADATSVAQPLYTFDELIEMGDEAINGCAVRVRGNKNIYVYDADKTDFVALPLPASPAPGTDNGFDVFTLGGVNYQVYPTGPAYTTKFAIADFEGKLLYDDERDNLHGGGATFSGSITARKVDEHTVDVYTYYPTPSGAYVAKFVVSDETNAVSDIAVDEAEGEAVYYNLQGVRVAGEPANGIYLKVANGKASKVLVK